MDDPSTSDTLSETGGPDSAVALEDTDAVLRAICRDVLGLHEERVAGFDRDTGLFGHLPELDSMAVASLLTEIEDRMDITIDDDEVDGDMLENYGALLDFAHAKRIAG